MQRTEDGVSRPLSATMLAVAFPGRGAPVLLAGALLRCEAEGAQLVLPDINWLRWSYKVQYDFGCGSNKRRDEEEGDALKVLIQSLSIFACPCNTHAQLGTREGREADLTHIIQGRERLVTRDGRRRKLQRPFHLGILRRLAAMGDDDESVESQPWVTLVNHGAIVKVGGAEERPATEVVICLLAGYPRPHAPSQDQRQARPGKTEDQSQRWHFQN